MKIGLTLPPGLSRSATAAVVEAADRAGLFGVLCDSPGGSPGDAQGDSPDGVTLAAEVALASRDLRVVARVGFGTTHPVSLAEEVAVLDVLSGGRAVVVADVSALDAAGAEEDLALFTAALSARPFRHEGARWTVPSGVMGPDLPRLLTVTPHPVQVEVPLWVHHRGGVLLDTPLPAVVTDPGAVDAVGAARRCQPGTARLSGELDADRSLVQEWSRAGVTHLLCEVAPELLDDPVGFLAGHVARHLVPEATVPDFPRVIADAPTPAPWPIP